LTDTQAEGHVSVLVTCVFSDHSTTASCPMVLRSVTSSVLVTNKTARSSVMLLDRDISGHMSYNTVDLLFKGIALLRALQ
jgi:hypothetical protein